MSWLDKFFNVGIVTVQIAGAPMPAERTINFVSGVTATDDATNGRTNLTVSGGGGGGGYATVEGNGSAVTQRGTLNFIGATVADNAGASRTDVTIQGGPTVKGTATGTTSLTAAAWVIQPCDTGAGPFTVTADAAAAAGQIVQLPDAATSGSYQTNAITFNGGGRNVKDPYGATAPAASWTSPAGFKTQPGWILLPDHSGTLTWTPFACC